MASAPDPSAAAPVAQSPPAAEEGPAVGIDTDSYAGDSAYDSELASYTTSLASSITDYKHENGRRYHAFKEGRYVYPNDEKEMDRLDITHKMIETAMDGKLYAAPLKNPQRILDIGTGTGIWAIEMGDQFEKCDIIGNDLSPIQPKWVPPNVRFEVDDIEADWTYSTKFDFIHCRCMYTSILDWNRLMSQTYENLEPGGFCEFTDVDLKWKSPDNTLAGTTGEFVNSTFIAACNKGDREPCPGPKLENWVKEAGFEDVHHKTMIIPFGTWPADKKLKEVGAWNHLQVMEGLESFFSAVFTRMLGYRKEEVDVLCAKVRENLRDPKFHSYYNIHNVWGRKPGTKKTDDIDNQKAPAPTVDSKAEEAAPAAKESAPATKDSAPAASTTAPATSS